MWPCARIYGNAHTADRCPHEPSGLSERSVSSEGAGGGRDLVVCGDAAHEVLDGLGSQCGRALRYGPSYTQEPRAAVVQEDREGESREAVAATAIGLSPCDAVGGLDIEGTAGPV